jgi:5-methylcytosine-specific restriction protein A
MPSKSKTFRPQHAQTQRQLRADYDKRRGNDPATVERRKLYKSKAWLQLRALKLANDPLCEYCKARGKATPAREVDHWRAVITHPHLALEYDNLRAACTPCHSSKTRAENSGRPWRGCDLQGHPLDPRHPWNQEKHGGDIERSDESSSGPTLYSETRAGDALGKKEGTE